MKGMCDSTVRTSGEKMVPCVFEATHLKAPCGMAVLEVETILGDGDWYVICDAAYRLQRRWKLTECRC